MASRVVYPDGYEGYWNACNVTGDFSANTLNIDDVGFLTALAGKLVGEIGIDPEPRLCDRRFPRRPPWRCVLRWKRRSTSAPSPRYRTSVPTPDNFKCKPGRRRHLVRSSS